MTQTPVPPLEAKKYVIPRYAVDHLLESFQIVRTELSELLDIPDTNQAEWSQYAEQWWSNQSEEDRYILRKIITAMGSPVLVSNITVFSGDTRLLNTRAVFTSTRLEDPAFFIGLDEDEQSYRVSYVDSGNEILATLVMYLDAGADLGKTEFRVSMSLHEFITFLGLMDLYRRNEYISMLEHSRDDFLVGYEEIWKSVQDGAMHPDLRWTLPFVIPQLIHDTAPPTQEEVYKVTQSLAQRGILQWDPNAEAFTLSEPGMFCALSLMKVINKINITSMGFNKQGKRARKGAVFIRTDPIIWAILIDGGKAMFTSIGLDPAADLVREILSPTTVPAIRSETTVEPPIEAGQTPMCPKCGKPATWIEAYKRWYCYNCREYLPP